MHLLVRCALFRRSIAYASILLLLGGRSAALSDPEWSAWKSLPNIEGVQYSVDCLAFDYGRGYRQWYIRFEGSEKLPEQVHIWYKLDPSTKYWVPQTVTPGKVSQDPGSWDIVPTTCEGEPSVLATTSQPQYSPATLNHPVQRLVDVANILASKSLYLPNGKQTQCSAFVRDFVAMFFGQPDPALSTPRISVQIQKLSFGSGWLQYAPGNDASATQIVSRATSFANQGYVVLLYWLNPAPTPSDSGHAAVVMPSSLDGTKWSRNWGAQVPYVAQAGQADPTAANLGVVTTGVDSAIPMSSGFTREMVPKMIMFYRKP